MGSKLFFNFQLFDKKKHTLRVALELPRYDSIHTLLSNEYVSDRKKSLLIIYACFYLHSCVYSTSLVATLNNHNRSFIHTFISIILYHCKLVHKYGEKKNLASRKAVQS